MSVRLTIVALFASIVATSPAGARPVSIREALDSTKRNNASWRSMAEGLVQVETLKDVAFGMLLPKVQVQGQWMHMGERNTPNMSGLDDLEPMLCTVARQMPQPAEGSDMAEMLERCPEEGKAFEDGGGGGSFDSFVPRQDIFSATFSVVVPVLEPGALAFYRGAPHQVDAAVQRIGHGREQMLYGVSKAYYMLLGLQTSLEMADRRIESAQEHLRTTEAKASLQAATQMEVKRAALERASAESQRVKLAAALEKARAAFRYLTGMAGPIEVTADDLPAGVLPHTVEQWVELARKQRKDLLAARIEVKVAEGEREKVWAKYVPSLALMGQGKLDNNEAQRFDDDPFSWNVMATLTLNAWDGGIREAELKAVESKLRQAALAVEDLDKRIESEVRAAFQALSDSKASSTLAQRQQELALATQALAKAAEQAGAATGLEVIDANTMVFMSEIQLVTAGIEEGTAILDLRSATGSPLPFGE